MKALLVSLLLCTPALAQPAPSQSQSYVFKVAVDGGNKVVRNYTVDLVQDACGEINTHIDSTRDEIKLCAFADGAKIRLKVEWRLQDKDRELENKSELLLARKDSRVLDGGTAKLNVTML